MPGCRRVPQRAQIIDKGHGHAMLGCTGMLMLSTPPYISGKCSASKEAGIESDREERTDGEFLVSSWHQSHTLVSFTQVRAETITTFALCGFANLSSIGIMLGGLCELAA